MEMISNSKIIWALLVIAVLGLTGQATAGTLRNSYSVNEYSCSYNWQSYIDKTDLKWQLQPYYEAISLMKEKLEIYTSATAYKGKVFSRIPIADDSGQSPKYIFIRTNVMSVDDNNPEMTIEVLSNLYTPFGNIDLLGGKLAFQLEWIKKTFLDSPLMDTVDVTDKITGTFYGSLDYEKYGPYGFYGSPWEHKGATKIYLVKRVGDYHFPLSSEEENGCFDSMDYQEMGIEGLFKELSGGTNKF